MEVNNNISGTAVQVPDIGTHAYLDWLDTQAGEDATEVDETTTLDLGLDLTPDDDALSPGDDDPTPLGADAMPVPEDIPSEFDYSAIANRGVISQDSLAAALGAHSFNFNAKFASDLGTWVLYDNASGWTIDRRSVAAAHVRDFLRGAVDHLVDQAEDQEALGDDKAVGRAIRRGEAILSRNSIIAIDGLARQNPASVALAEDFDTDIMLLGTPDGVVDLKTGILRPHQRGDMITKRVAITPAALGAKPERWLRFMDEVFEGDAEKIGMLQRIAGYALTGSTKARVVIYLHGKGGDGKSTTLRVLDAILGDYSRRVHISTFLLSNGNAHPTNVAALRGARLVTASELPENATWNDQVLKELTGRETLTAREMRQNFFDFEPQMTLLISGNHLPNLQGVDKALRDRIIILPYNRSFAGTDAEDQDLPERLIEEEGPAILRWCIEGALEWQRVGIKPTSDVKKASAEYLDGEDIVGAFLAEMTVQEPGAAIFKSDLFDAFIGMIDQQRAGSWTSNRMTKALRKLDIASKRSTGGKELMLDIRLKTPVELGAADAVAVEQHMPQIDPEAVAAPF